MIPTYRPYLGPEELEAVRGVFDSRWLGMGPLTERLENELARLFDVKHVVMVNSGTAALHLAMIALDLQPSDEVIVPSLTFVASVHAITLCHAKPVFAEVNEETLLIDPEHVRRSIPRRCTGFSQPSSDRLSELR